MHPAADAHLTLHHAHHRELVAEADNARLARALSGGRPGLRARITRTVQALGGRRGQAGGTAAATPRVAP